ncbi:hypothetical protein [Spiroplasma sp. BIUS-1]|uniref:hypothetical protein n=1 Tax=Spiroplasma sp. BIUS-1 TaxID=216964 RepID=UPI0013996616|nr:hypothetical protein [Spiroplasma sp. BIUS-1]QHX36812.1 hypothetical protein SBIUS_v1c05590 [Spiroplasma sp. BIUS-1]
MFYANNDFWSEKGADFVSTYLELIGVPSSKDEIYELIAEEEYLDEEIASSFEPIVINLIKAWSVIREIVLQVKDYEKKHEKRVSFLIIDLYKKLYMCLIGSNEYLKLFEGETEQSQEFLSKLEKIVSKMSTVETFDSLVEYLLAAVYDFTINNYLGERTFRYFFWMVESVMISRGFGLAVFEDLHEQEEIKKLHAKTISFANQNSSKNFALSKDFRKIVSMFKDKIEQFSIHEKEKYLNV